MPNTIYEEGRIAGFFGWPKTTLADNPYQSWDFIRHDSWRDGCEDGIDEIRTVIAEKRLAACRD